MGMHPKIHLLDKYKIFYDLLFNDNNESIDLLIKMDLISYDQKLKWSVYLNDIQSSINLKSNLKDYFYLKLHSDIEKNSYLSSKKALGIVKNLYNCADGFQINIRNNDRLKNCTIIDYGSGIFRTLNHAIILYCNGFGKVFAYEPYPLQTDFVIRSIYQLFEMMLTNPSDFIFTDIDVNEFIARLKLLLSTNYFKIFNDFQINSNELINFNNVIFLTSNLKFIDDHIIDFHFSNAVLEHINDIEDDLTGLQRILKTDSIGFHIVDFLDHRYYYNNSLSPMEKYYDDVLFEINGFTPSEMELKINSSGFKYQKIQALKIPDKYLIDEARPILLKYSSFGISELTEHVNWYLLRI